MRFTEAGYALLLANSQNRPDREASNVALFRQRAVDGLLLSISDEQDQGSLEQLTEFDRPVVLLDRDVELSAASRVLFDHATGFRAAARHLVEVATALGATGATVRSLDDLQSAAAAIEARRGPVLIDLRIDPPRRG